MAGTQAPHHQPIKLGSVGQGPATVTVVPGDPMCMSVIGGSAPLHWLCQHPLPLWSPPSDIAAWAQVCLARGSLLGCPGAACAQRQPLKGCPWEGGCAGFGHPHHDHHDGFGAHSASIWFGHVPQRCQAWAGSGAGALRQEEMGVSGPARH